MKLLKIWARKSKKNEKKVDYYQAALEKFGRDQLQSLVNKGLGAQFR